MFYYSYAYPLHFKKIHASHLQKRIHVINTQDFENRAFKNE